MAVPAAEPCSSTTNAGRTSINNLLLTCDWGRSVVFSHDLPKNGPTFDAQQSDFLKLPRPTDICADGSGRIYVASWKNGRFGYDGPNIGFVAMVKPSGFVPKPVPDLNAMSPLELVETLKHPSARVRLAGQRQLLRLLPKTKPEGRREWNAVEALATDQSQPLFARIAAIYAFSQVNPKPGSGFFLASSRKRTPAFENIAYEH